MRFQTELNAGRWWVVDTNAKGSESRWIDHCNEDKDAAERRAAVLNDWSSRKVFGL
jgi:hypothetical protein